MLDKVSPRAHDALFSDQTLRDHFLNPKSECAAFIVAIDIRRSAELMIKARTAELFGKFMARLCDELRMVICGQFGVVDKFTGDGLLASFPEFSAAQTLAIEPFPPHTKHMLCSPGFTNSTGRHFPRCSRRPDWASALTTGTFASCELPVI